MQENNINEFARVAEVTAETFKQYKKGIELIAKSFSEQVESFNKVIEIFNEEVFWIKEIGKEVTKFFEKTIYLSPEVYENFLSLKIALSSKEIEQGLKEGTLVEEDIYTAYTIDQSSINKFKTTSFKVTKNVAKAIKVLIKNKPQFMTLETEDIVFNEVKCVLVLNGYTVGLKGESDRYNLCKFMFGSEEGKIIPWGVGDLVYAMGKDFSDKSKDWYTIVYGKVRYLNKAIEDVTGYKNFVVSRNGFFTIKPEYLFLYKK